MYPSYQQFNVLSPGLYTSIQDKGRFGFQKFGVPVSGTLDSQSAMLANFLVGNSETCAVLEMTVQGPQMVATNNAYIAITGAEIEVTLNKRRIESYKAIKVEAGDSLEFGRVQSGCRSYLAVTGGFLVPEVMGSRSCYVGGKIGGTEGRTVQPGDRLRRLPGSFPEFPRVLPREVVPKHSDKIILRAIPGPQDDYFDDGLERFFNAEYTVSADANRIGYRLDGPAITQKEGMAASIVSEASVPGGVQIPPNGLPIILLGEQTVGGYTKIATVISSDLDLIGQASPGDTIRFEKTNLENAYRINEEKRKQLSQIKEIADLLSKAQLYHSQQPHFAQDRALEQFQELYPECS